MTELPPLRSIGAPPTPESARYLTANDVAEMLGVSMPTVLTWWRDGKIPGYRLGGGSRGPVRFRSDEIEEKLAEWRRAA